MQDALESLYAVVSDRKANPQEGSYTCYLFEKGLDKILKKCGEECSETIIAAKNHDPGMVTAIQTIFQSCILLPTLW